LAYFGELLLRVPFRRLRPEARVPVRAYTGVSTGIAIAVPDGYAGLVLPRSGLATRFGVSLVNTPGLIDPGYRGELMVPLINHDRDETFEVEVGMRIAQLVLVKAAEAYFVNVELLEESADDRGEGGFGSSDLSS
jgi:dUTP pyrophosphatase